ncbi:hypothetical protein [Sulfurovum sp.]|uniref:hypothetical protein n=1 Tax=Sulfurovum sp. TaxID=1969726 RepID=UPI002A363FC1|nr:hypothetical protein [Sulfurovum sp.]MDD2451591.1 hypothetical protein [Sulfurovum sp.]MDD3500031.1 hypothetical protein [Sulfurovum sp.]MDY0402655.1 hypothetical protein [Sulfurovum sp.]
MKKSRFSHLFPQEKSERDNLPTSNAKKAVLVLLTLFFILYVNYKPYAMTPHQINGIFEFLFTLYQFIINQTLGIIHEGGHGVCYILPCPKFVMVAMGTVFQWLFPLGIAYYYKKRGNQTAFLTGLFILGISMDYTAWYMSTAHEGAILPAHKSFLGVNAMHDFHYIFSTLGVLAYESLISGVTRVIAYLLMIGAVIGMFFEAFSNKH